MSSGISTPAPVERQTYLARFLVQPRLRLPHFGDLAVNPCHFRVKNARLFLQAFLHLVVCAILIVKVVVFVSADNSYYMMLKQRLFSGLHPKGDSATATDTDYVFYSFSEAVSFMNTSYNNWRVLAEDTTGMWTQGDATMTTKYLTHGTYREVLEKGLPLDYTTLTTPLSDISPTGPFGGPEMVTDIMARTHTVSSTFLVETLRVMSNSIGECVEWEARQEYSVARHVGSVRFNMILTPSLCDIGYQSRSTGTFLSLSIITIILSCILAVLHLRQYWRLRLGPYAPIPAITVEPAEDINTSVRRASQASLRRCRTSSNTVSDMNGGRRESFATDADDDARTQVQQALTKLIIAENTGPSWRWEVVLSLTMILVFVTGIMDVVFSASRYPVSHSTWLGYNMMRGISDFLALVGLVSYAGQVPRLYLLITTLQNGTPKAFKFAVGCSPLFMGYALLGTHVFGPYCPVHFGTLDLTCKSLFAVLNGDVMDDTFSVIFPSQGAWLQVFSRVYLYSFVILFIYAVLNVFMAIMEDAYFQVKRSLLLDLQETMVA